MKVKDTYRTTAACGLFQLILLFPSKNSALTWQTCKIDIKSEGQMAVIELCDLCYVPEQKQTFKEDTFLIPIVKSALLTRPGYWYCTSNMEPYVVPQDMVIGDMEHFQLLAECPSQQTAFQGNLAILLNKNLNSLGISEEVKADGQIDDNITWMFVNSNSPLYEKYGIRSELFNFFKVQPTSKVSSSIINLKGAPRWLKLIAALCAFLSAFTCLLLTVLIRKFDKNHFVYALELFLHCKRQKEKLTIGIFIGRITILGSFIGGLVIIIFALTFTLVPVPFQYILDVCFLIASSSAFMFLWARLVILIKVRKKTLTMRHQTLLVIPSVPIGLLAGVLIILYKDETYLGAKAALAYNKIAVIWWCTSFCISLALLLHVNCRSYNSLFIFISILIAMDQSFRLIWFAKSVKILKEKKPFIDHYYEYDGPEIPISQGFRYQNQTTMESDYDLYKTPRTNPFVFKFQVEYGNLPCQTPYTAFFPIWYAIIPGMTLMHILHFNHEHSENPSRICTAVLIVITIVTTAAEEIIRVFVFQIGIGGISFPSLSIFALIWFKCRGELKDFIKGFEEFVERPSRSIVSSGSHLTRTSSEEEVVSYEPERMSTPITTIYNYDAHNNIEVAAPPQPKSQQRTRQSSKRRKRRKMRRRRSNPEIASYSLYRKPDRTDQNSSTSTKFHVEERTYLTYY